MFKRINYIQIKEFALKTLRNYFHFFLISIITAIFASQWLDFRTALFANIHTFALGMLGLLVFASDATRKIEFQKEQWDNERKHLDDDLRTVKLVSDKITHGICSSLKNDVHWASDALEKAKIIGMRQNTLFSERLSYYPLEKECLADQFASLLLKRCKFLLESNQYKKIYLIIDSGTTLYSLFAKLGEHARNYIDLDPKEKDWICNLEIVTNNLPGLLLYMDKGRIDLNSRYSRLIIKSCILPGEPVPIYSAVTGSSTVKALEIIKKQSDDERGICIGIVTGNWVRIRRGDNSNPIHCPVPSARGDNHREFKQALIDCSKEIYVVAPLGKVIYNENIGDTGISDTLGYTATSKNEDNKPYMEVKIENDKPKYVRLVSTSRGHGRLLSRYSDMLRGLLGHFDREESEKNFIKAAAGDVPHLFFTEELFYPIDRESTQMDVDIEFPVRRIRKVVMEKLFNIKQI